MARHPIEAGMLVLPEEEGGPPRLLGSRCESCAATFHPARPVCLACHGRELATVELSGRGTLYACTRVAMPLRPGRRERRDYWVAHIDLDDGPRVQGLLAPEIDDPQIGMRLAPGLEVLKVEENGDELVVHHFGREGAA